MSKRIFAAALAIPGNYDRNERLEFAEEAVKRYWQLTKENDDAPRNSDA